MAQRDRLDVILEVVQLLQAVSRDIDICTVCEQVAVASAKLFLHFFQRLLTLFESVGNIFAAAFGIDLTALLHTSLQIVHLTFHYFHRIRLIHAVHMLADGYIVGVVQQINNEFVVAFIRKPSDKHNACKA